jgi:mRNA-degrading endonuclease toxin of MazEF toxin-antitoxin module
MSELLAAFDPQTHRRQLAFDVDPTGSETRQWLMHLTAAIISWSTCHRRPERRWRVSSAVVLSEQAFSVATGWVVACSITTKIKGSPREVQIPRGLTAPGCVVASELRTMDYIARRTRFMGKAPRPLLQQAQAIACATIGRG